MMIAYKESCQGDYCIMAKDCSVAKAANADYIRREIARRNRNNTLQRVGIMLKTAINQLKSDIELLDFLYNLYMRFK